MAERGGGGHQKFVDAAKLYLNKLAAENDFTVDYITGTERINEESLAQYKLFIQLNYPPLRQMATLLKTNPHFTFHTRTVLSTDAEINRSALRLNRALRTPLVCPTYRDIR